MSASSGACTSEAGYRTAVSRFDPSVMLTEMHAHVRKNRAQARTTRVRRCVLVDGSPGVAITAKNYVWALSADDAIGLADALVDAVEAGQE